jgi:hypothetical protein
MLNKGNFTSIDFSGASFTWSSGINPADDIVGLYVAGTPVTGVPATTTDAFLLSKGNFTTISIPAVTFTVHPIKNNPRGDIVGGYLDANGTEHGFLLSKGRFTTIDVPGAASTSTFP